MLTLDQSSDDEANKRGRLVFFALPQGTERGRSLAVGDLDGDHKKDVIVTDPANAQVWVYLQTGRLGPELGIRRSPAWATRAPFGSPSTEPGGKDEVYVLSEQEKQIGRSIFDKGRLSFPDAALTGRRTGRDGRGRPRWRQGARDPLRRRGMKAEAGERHV